MTGDKVLLDTNIIIAFLEGEPKAHQSLADKGMYCSVINYGELVYGALSSGRVAYNLRRIKKLVENFDVLPITTQIAERFGKVRTELRKSGKPIPENDIWIAATCLEYGLALVTRDQHFDFIEHLRVEKF